MLRDMRRPLTRPHRLAFHLAAAGAALAAVYHLTAITVPAFGAIAYPAGYPIWRHVVFILVDATLAGLLLRRPIWLIWPYILLTIQVFNGHGVSAWRSFRGPGHIDWVSVVTVIGIVFILALLLLDWRERRAGDAHV